MVDVVASETNGREPIQAGAAEPNIDLVLEVWGRYANLGCQGVSVTGPYYFKVRRTFVTFAPAHPVCNLTASGGAKGRQGSGFSRSQRVLRCLKAALRTRVSN